MHYSIKELETLSGVKAHTLRIWEQRYKFIAPERTDTNIRLYNQEQLKHILNVALLRRNGLKISTIARMTTDDVRNAVQGIIEQEHAPSLMDEFQNAMLDMNEAHFEKTFSLALNKMGFEELFTQLIFPFLERCASYWTSGCITSSQQVFIHQLVRRKLCVAIDHIFHQPEANAKCWLLFLPAGETNDLLLLYIEYLLRKQQHRVVNVGSALMADSDTMVKMPKADALVAVITRPVLGATLEKMVQFVRQKFEAVPLYCGGSFFSQWEEPLPKEMHRFFDPHELLAQPLAVN
ncbi:MAG: MerR family transcriptional regulator [Chitinophagales bacterium]